MTQVGSATAILLQGQVVTPDQSFAGEVLVIGDTIQCVDVDCSAAATGANASIVQTNGIIFPGLIDTHNHILFDIFDEDDWSPSQVYTNHNQWPNNAKYMALVNAKQYLNGESGSPVNYNCEMEKFGELKGLIAGTTSIVSAANPANKGCYGTLARTIDQSPNGLGSDQVQEATLFPTATSAKGVCANYADGSTDAYLIHVAEGVDSSALAEFTKLGTITADAGTCLYASQTNIVHGTALGGPQFDVMVDAGMSLTWSPASNVFLYGWLPDGGSDLTKTTDIPLARTKGISISLAPDWSIGGSQNLLDELRFADKVDNTVWGDTLSPQDLADMVTTHPAHALALEGTIGSLTVGTKADLMVIDGDPTQPYEALLAATPREVRLVMVGGDVLYGDASVQPIAASVPGCEALDVCCRSKFICVAASGATSTNLFGETLSDIESTLDQGLTALDALPTSTYAFSPRTPLIKCP